MIKSILYTSNPDMKVHTFDDVQCFAAINNKYFTCVAKKGTPLYDLKAGAHVLTQKGNNVYILEVIEGVNEFDDAKKSNITGIVSVDYPFGEPEEDMLDSIKDVFAFNEVEDVKVSIYGQLCVRTSNGYVAITKEGKLMRYPKGLVLDIPVYAMPKAKKDVQVGDVIVADGTYAMVVSVDGDSLETISYKGTGSVIYPIKDFLMGDEFVQVITSPFSDSTNINPMMMLALSKGSDNLLPLLMMQQQGGNINPMMMLALTKKHHNNDLLETIMMMQMMNNQPKAPMFIPGLEIEE